MKADEKPGRHPLARPQFLTAAVVCLESFEETIPISHVIKSRIRKVTRRSEELNCSQSPPDALPSISREQTEP